MLARRCVYNGGKAPTNGRKVGYTVGSPTRIPHFAHPASTAFVKAALSSCGTPSKRGHKTQMPNNKRYCAYAICAGAVCLLAVPAAAQTANGWEVQFELLRMDVKGADEHTGEVVTLSETQTLNPPQVSDHVAQTPIDLNMAARNTIRADVTYRGARWGAGVGGWYLRTDDALSGHLSSAPPSTTPSSVSSVFNTVLMWNELLSPVQNDIEASRLSPVDYQVSGRLRTYTVDGFAVATLAGGGDTRLELVVGGKFARVRRNQGQDVKVRSFLLNAFRPLHLNNNINLSSVADARVDGAGPMVGWAARTRWRRLRIDASVTESVLYASSKQSGTFIDIDDITLAQTPTGPFITCPPALASFGCFGVRSDWDVENSTKAVIPVTDLQLKVMVDVTRQIAVGGSSFTSIWNNVVSPPAFTITHANAGPGLEWDFGQRTLRFGSAGLVASVRF